MELLTEQAAQECACRPDLSVRVRCVRQEVLVLHHLPAACGRVLGWFAETSACRRTCREPVARLRKESKDQRFLQVLGPPRGEAGSLRDLCAYKIYQAARLSGPDKRQSVSKPRAVRNLKATRVARCRFMLWAQAGCH